MKEDKLKEFVKKHKSELDFESPPDFSMDKFVSKKPKMVRLSSVLKIAAVALLFLSIGGIYLITLNNKSSVKEYAQKEGEVQLEELSLAIVSDELGEMEAYYTKKINNTYLEIKEEGMVEEVKKQMEELDLEYDALKLELLEGMDNPFIIEEMIENYRMKLKLLENVLKKIRLHKNNLEELNPDNDEKYTVYT